MKKLYSNSKIMFVLFLIGLFLSITVNGQTPWNDDFESYNAGTWPATWVADGNATDISSNYIDNTIAYQEDQSLRLHGVLGGNWGALAYHPVSLNYPYEVEVVVRNGDEILTGAHPDRAGIGLRQGTSWSNPERRFISFKGDGAIESGGGLVALGSYSTLTWYTMRILYERPTSSQVRLSYWIDGDFKGDELLPAITNEDQLTNLELHVQEGTAWFDNVSVSGMTGFFERQIVETVNIYPNPFKKLLYLNSQTTNPEIIEIYDLTGRIVYNEIFETSIDLSHLNECMYLLFVKDANGKLIHSEKIIKE